MEKKEESDWYYGVLSGALKFFNIGGERESLPVVAADSQAQVDLQDIACLSVADEGKAQFCEFVHAVHEKPECREQLARGIVEALTQTLRMDSAELKKLCQPSYSQSSDQHSLASIITEEDLDEKIATQLSAVIDESVTDLKGQRKAFRNGNQKTRDEFQKKLFQIHGGDTR